MSTTNEELKQLFENYMNDVSEKGLEGITAYYHEPLMVFSPKGVTVLESNKQLVDFFAPMVAELNTDGYDRMEATEINAKTLNEETAIVSNVVVRYKKDGSVLNRGSGTYVLHRNSQGWKIGTLIMGDADSVIRF